MAHTRWATHGQPSPLNCHPHHSDPKNEFTVVHNGIITNFRELKLVLEKRGYSFETETDTESVAVLIKYIYDSTQGRKPDFTSLVKSVIKELVSFGEGGGMRKGDEEAGTELGRSFQKRGQMLLSWD